MAFYNEHVVHFVIELTSVTFHSSLVMEVTSNSLGVNLRTIPSVLRINVF